MGYQETLTNKTPPELRKLELNGGRVEGNLPYRLTLPATDRGYADAQLDDYAGLRRRDYAWRPGAHLRLRARFSHPAAELRGTAGFGFWNAPFGDPSVRRPALPQATWFFFGSAPTDLPLAPLGEGGQLQPGRGWFASTLDATRWRAIRLIPLTPAVLLLNQFARVRRRLWPAVRRQLGISYGRLPAVELTEWHAYALTWRPDGCLFQVDGETVFETPHSPQGPLGFVCWLDNQYMLATPTGRFRWGTLTTGREQWLEVAELRRLQA